MLHVKRALISVSNKEGIVPFAKQLRACGVEIVSTGGTLALLRKHKILAKSVTELTGFPEILDGRVKTLHPAVHGGLLFRRNTASHKREIKKHNIAPIDMVVVNLYPFTDVIKKKGVALEDALENIDIGGPTMLRSAAKNYESVAVICENSDYGTVIEMLKEHKGKIPSAMLKGFAAKVFRLTAHYDGHIAKYLTGYAGETLPAFLHYSYKKVSDLRYGENPHQRGALYIPFGSDRQHVKQLHGKELSYNNLLDLSGAVEIIRETSAPAAAVIKHTNPCGLAEASRLDIAMDRALDSDLKSAFGGIVIVNRLMDGKTAGRLLKKLPFFEVVIAPRYSFSALKQLKQRKRLIILEMNIEQKTRDVSVYAARFVESGLLVQDFDTPVKTSLSVLRKKLKVVTKRKPTKQDIDELLFAWKCAKVVKSNAIVITKNKATVGIGAGQMSRVDSMAIACQKAEGKSGGAYIASDGFFPMADNIEVAHRAGIRAIIQPGGSIRDGEVIDAANNAGIIMVFTGQRHFRH